MDERLRIGIAEAIGTMILIVGGPGTAVLATGNFFPKGSVGILGVALAFGLSLLVAAYAIGSISGCHINPAVTLGLWVIGKTKTRELPFYIVGQIVGGLIGALVIFIIAKSSAVAFSAQTSGFASNGYGIHSPGGFKLGAVMLAEVFFTAVFVFIIASTSRLSMPVGLTGVTVGPHPHRHPPDLHPDRQHLGEPGPEPLDGRVPGQLGPESALGLHRLPHRRGHPRGCGMAGPPAGIGRGARRVVRGRCTCSLRSASPAGVGAVALLRPGHPGGRWRSARQGVAPCRRSRHSPAVPSPP